MLYCDLMIEICFIPVTAAFDSLYLHRVSEREAALESALLMLQVFYLDLEKFLAWLTEAETTANVLQDATHKEKILEDAKTVWELMKQWQVSQVLLFRGMSVIQSGISPLSPQYAATQQN